MWSVIGGVLSLIALVVGFYLKKKKTKQEKMIDILAKEAKSRGKLKEDGMSVYDMDTMDRVEFLLKLRQKRKNPPE